MFISYIEKKGTGYFEFQYCKKDCSIQKILKKGYDFWTEDSLFVSISNEEKLLDNYYKYLRETNTPDGTNKFNPYGVNYYTKEQTLSIINEIKKDKPENYERLVLWLENAVKLNGFFVLGI